ncbi:Rv1733c family protein [Streptomyces sp. 900105755]
MPLKAFRGPKVWLWRWRRNPLKRRADTMEAWVLLGAWLLTLLAGVFAGVAAARSVEDGLARERVEWHPVVAHVLDKAPGSADAKSGSSGSSESSKSSDSSNGERVWARVGWTVADGSAHSGQARVPAGSRVGTPVTVWTDLQGHLVTRPVTTSEAHLRSALIGGLVGLSAAAVPFVAGLVARGRLERRRMDRWDAEWARLGPQWGRMTG